MMPDNDAIMGVFPAYAGMNRHSHGTRDRTTGVPRIRGDEPLTRQDGRRGR